MAKRPTTPSEGLNSEDGEKNIDEYKMIAHSRQKTHDLYLALFMKNQYFLRPEHSSSLQSKLLFYNFNFYFYSPLASLSFK